MITLWDVITSPQQTSKTDHFYDTDPQPQRPPQTPTHTHIHQTSTVDRLSSQLHVHKALTCPEGQRAGLCVPCCAKCSHHAKRGVPVQALMPLGMKWACTWVGVVVHSRQLKNMWKINKSQILKCFVEQWKMGNMTKHGTRFCFVLALFPFGFRVFAFLRRER